MKKTAYISTMDISIYDCVVLSIMLMLLCCQKLSVVSFGNFSLKYSHLFFPIYLLYAFSRAVRNMRIPVTGLGATFLLLFSLFVFDIPLVGINSIILNYTFMFSLIYATYLLAQHLSNRSLENVIRRVAWLCIVIIYVNYFLHPDSIYAYLSGSSVYRPSVTALFSGGINLEASWIALFGVFFDDDKEGIVYLVLVFGISFINSSRAAFIICTLVFVYLFGVKRKDPRAIVSRLSFLTFILIVFCLVLFLAGAPLVMRFLSIGSETGSLGRFTMWRYAWPAFLQHPLIGHGAGNAVEVLRRLSGIQFKEGNIHNYYLQVAIDFGIVGLATFLVLIVRFYRKNIQSGFANPFAAYIAIYLVAAFIQFRGADALVGFCLGGYLAWSSNQTRSPTSPR